MQSATATNPSRADDTSALVAEKRIDRITIRLGDTLHSRLQERAHQSGTSISNYLVHIAARDAVGQEPSGQTLADEIEALRSLLQLPLSEIDHITAVQRLWIIRRLARLTMMMAGVRR